MSASHFILSAICIGFANTIIEWFIIGFLFHKYQALTPQTWRPENYRSYTYSALLSFLFGVLFTFFYFKIGAHYVLRGNVLSHIKLGLICFACFSFVSGINNAVYVNYDRKFVAGLLTASCLTYIAAAIIASFFYWR
ncbi:MAG: hypothetical protein JWQ66_255 [Mucilaginibacter sp.]|nr:hypothetical protein [Mucilaginibacter sp.]